MPDTQRICIGRLYAFFIQWRVKFVPVLNVASPSGVRNITTSIFNVIEALLSVPPTAPSNSCFPHHFKSKVEKKRFRGRKIIYDYTDMIDSTDFHIFTP